MNANLQQLRSLPLYLIGSKPPSFRHLSEQIGHTDLRRLDTRRFREIERILDVRS